MMLGWPARFRRQIIFGKKLGAETVKAGFFLEFAQCRHVWRFSPLNLATGKSIKIGGRRTGTSHEQQPVFVNDDGRGGRAGRHEWFPETTMA